MVMRNPEVIGPRLLIKLKPVETMSAGGIVLETEATKSRTQNATQEGYIIEIGSNAFGDYLTKPNLNIGDLVKIVKYAGYTSFVHDGDIYQTVNDVDIVNKMRGEGLND
jgi:co-chaperonin GroES (HSP10)